VTTNGGYLKNVYQWNFTHEVYRIAIISLYVCIQMINSINEPVLLSRLGDKTAHVILKK
jgi:hypothetical protein